MAKSITNQIINHILGSGNLHTNVESIGVPQMSDILDAVFKKLTGDIIPETVKQIKSERERSARLDKILVLVEATRNGEVATVDAATTEQGKKDYAEAIEKTEGTLGRAYNIITGEANVAAAASMLVENCKFLSKLSGSDPEELHEDDFYRKQGIEDFLKELENSIKWEKKNAAVAEEHLKGLQKLHTTAYDVINPVIQNKKATYQEPDKETLALAKAYVPAIARQDKTEDDKKAEAAHKKVERYEKNIKMLDDLDVKFGKLTKHLTGVIRRHLEELEKPSAISPENFSTGRIGGGRADDGKPEFRAL